jgi:hypothetical protein
MKSVLPISAGILITVGFILAPAIAPEGEGVASSAYAQARCNCKKGKQACVRCCDENKHPVGCKWGCDSCTEAPKKK